MAKTLPILQMKLRQAGLRLGAPIFMRIFKDPGTLEVWVQNDKGSFTRFASYSICYFSGTLGPKLKEGDNQSPEGFYKIKARQLNPNSSYHLSFNLGFPNAYDKFHKRTGHALMVHGNCVSIGCYAMTDAYIDEIFTLAYFALKHGQTSFQVHSFPFALTDENLKKAKSSLWYPFWKNLKEGYDFFERTKTLPIVGIKDGNYVFK